MQRGYGKQRTRVYPGQVFYAMHFDIFTKAFKNHMFVCIYSSDFDNSSDSLVAGLLITSKAKEEENYVELDENVEGMLKCTSYVDTAAQYRFSKKDIQAVLGSISCDKLMEIMLKRDKVAHKEYQQCLRAFANIKGYEVKYKEGEK